MNSRKGKDDMASEAINCRDMKNRNEFFTRVLSSFVFVPFIALLFLVPCEVFIALCLAICGLIWAEIFSNKIDGRWLARSCAATATLIGIVSFMYARHVYGPISCMFLICISSFSDIGAYVCGKLIGGPKLCPKISPNKTWAGFCGGLLFANLGFICMRKMFFSDYVSNDFLPSYYDNLFIYQLLVLSAVVGDLLESLFKRRIDVKDMGDIFPGHGGFFDRTDSLLMVSFVFMILDLLLG